jgi:probable rRNA maturation factor
MPISVENRPRLRGVAAPLRAIVRTALAVAGRRPGEIAVLLADDAMLRKLNQRWRGIDRATDVLSFPSTERPGPRIDGDLVISLERVSEQSRRYRVSRARELARLVVHGALHLAGHDHHAAAERERMRRAEASALRAVAPAIRALDRALRGPAS